MLRHATPGSGCRVVGQGRQARRCGGQLSIGGQAQACNRATHRRGPGRHCRWHRHRLWHRSPRPREGSSRAAAAHSQGLDGVGHQKVVQRLLQACCALGQRAQRVAAGRQRGALGARGREGGGKGGGARVVGCGAVGGAVAIGGPISGGRGALHCDVAAAQQADPEGKGQAQRGVWARGGAGGRGRRPGRQCEAQPRGRRAGVAGTAQLRCGRWAAPGTHTAARAGLSEDTAVSTSAQQPGPREMSGAQQAAVSPPAVGAQGASSHDMKPARHVCPVASFRARPWAPPSRPAQAARSSSVREARMAAAAGGVGGLAVHREGWK